MNRGGFKNAPPAFLRCSILIRLPVSGTPVVSRTDGILQLLPSRLQVTAHFDAENITVSPVEKGPKIAGGRSRVCPNFFCGLLFTGMCTLILWIITASQE